MPYRVQEKKSKKDGKEVTMYILMNSTSGKVIAAHKTMEAAKKQMAAIMANEGDMPKMMTA